MNLQQRAQALAACLLTLLLCMTAGPAARAADGPQPGSLSDVHASRTHLSAVLTVPATSDTVSIDPASLRATIGGHPADVTAEPVNHERRATMLLIDTSGSMGPDGIAAATAAARTFLDLAPSDIEVGLATFSDRPKVLVPPTRDRAKVRAALSGLRPGGETALYDALRLSAKALGAKGSRSIIVLSDGGDTVSGSTLPSTLSTLEQGGVRTEAVAFRTDESKFSALRSVTRATQGRLVQAGDSAALDRAFAAAAKALAGQVRLSVTVPDAMNGAQRLVVNGKANGRSLRAETEVRLPVIAPAPTPSAPQSSPDPAPAATETAPPAGSASGDGTTPPRIGATPFWSATWVWASAAGVFVGLLTVALLVAGSAFTPEGKRRIRNLDNYLGTTVTAKASAAKKGTSGMAGTVVRLSDAWAKRRESSARTALLLERADLPLRVGEWYVLQGTVTIGLFAVTWLWWHGSLLGAVAALLVGLAGGLGGTQVFLRFKAARRARRFEQQLPDVLTLVASSLSSGFSLSQAVDAITRDAAEPSAKEFSRALAETRIGADLEDSLERMAVRMDSTNLEWTTMAIRIQREVGGNLAETLRTTATTLRERAALHRQVRALSAEGRLSAYILIALPIGLFGYMLLVNRDYLSLLWTRAIGIGMLGAGVVALGIGIFWMRKTVEVNV